MRRRITSVAAVVAVAFSAADAANDEVGASFQRLFDHTPAAMPLGTQSDADPLQQAVNAQLRASLAAVIGQSFAAYGQDPLPARFTALRVSARR
jgi:hypothetical protein